MSPQSRRRALPIAIATGLSLSTLAIFTNDALSQEAPAADAPMLPEVNVIQENPQAETQPPKAKTAAAKSPAKATPKAAAQPAEPPSELSGVQSDAPSSPSPARTAAANTAAAAAEKLDARNTAGSQLKLSARETPATLNVVTEKEIAENGARDIVEVFRSVPGVLVGNNPGEPGSTVTRGIYAGLGYSIDGSRVTDPQFISRNYDSFNLERVAFLKGPASIVSGTNALAGTVNIVTKQAVAGTTFVEGMASYGSFDTMRFGAGLNVSNSPDAAFRSTVSFSDADSYIDDTSARKFAITNNARFTPTDRLTLTGSFDYFHDAFTPPYWGTPLVPRAVAINPSNAVGGSSGLVLDKSNRSTNYNYLDGKADADAYWLRGSAEYKLSPEWSFKNETSYYSADRAWLDAEYFGYSAGVIERYPTIITHDHSFWSDRASLSFDGRLGDLRNRFTSGVEYIATDFNSTRHFASAQTVDILNPDRGTFPEDNAANFDDGRNFFATSYGTTGVFLENALNVTPAWLLLGGIRYEKINLDRSVRNDNTGLITEAFNKEFENTTWRVGTTYEIVDGTSLFAQYATATIPISSLLTARLRNSGFDLSTGRSSEAGIKSTYLGGRATTTASVYQIDQDGILTRDPNNPTLTVQGGSLRSRGVEIETTVALTEQWNATASGTLVDVEYTELTQSVGGVAVSRAGNQPINASPYSLSASTSYRLDTLPMTLGVSVSYVGPFYTDTANTIEAKERTLVDAWVSYDIGSGTVRLRGRNLTDELYAEWADYNPAAVYLGAPRSFDVTYSVKW